jgi:uncharacterized protein (TIGR02444 family)
MNDTQSATTPFWRFSLKYYGQPGVSDACIALQDGCGIDVNLLLFLFWLASERQMLSPDEVKKLDATIKSWRELTIIPIRDTRRKLKGAKTFVDPAKQEALYAFIQTGPLGKPAEPPAAARANVAAFERAMGASFPKASVDVLVNAFDGLTGR